MTTTFDEALGQALSGLSEDLPKLTIATGLALNQLSLGKCVRNEDSLANIVRQVAGRAQSAEAFIARNIDNYDINLLILAPLLAPTHARHVRESFMRDITSISISWEEADRVRSIYQYSVDQLTTADLLLAGKSRNHQKCDHDVVELVSAITVFKTIQNQVEGIVSPESKATLAPGINESEGAEAQRILTAFRSALTDPEMRDTLSTVATMIAEPEGRQSVRHLFAGLNLHRVPFVDDPSYNDA